MKINKAQDCILVFGPHKRTLLRSGKHCIARAPDERGGNRGDGVPGTAVRGPNLLSLEKKKVLLLSSGPSVVITAFGSLSSTIDVTPMTSKYTSLFRRRF